MPTQTNFWGVSSAPEIDIRRFDEVSYHDLQSTLVSENGFKTKTLDGFAVIKPLPNEVGRKLSQYFINIILLQLTAAIMMINESLYLFQTKICVYGEIEMNYHNKASFKNSLKIFLDGPIQFQK